MHFHRVHNHLHQVVLACVCIALCTGPAMAQEPPPPGTAAEEQPKPPPPPSIRRWLDVQHVHLSSRFRWVESSAGRLTSSTHQWQPQLRARFLVDRRARVSLHVGAFGGSHFVSGWNNTGGGVGEFGGTFNVKQVFIAAQPTRALELQLGSLYLVRGESSEVTTYDNDAYIVGERAVFRRAEGVLAQVSATAGFIGDYRTPNAFRRLRRLGEWNYGQLLLAARAGRRVNLSTDYTHEDGRDIFRQSATIRTSGSGPLTSLKLEAYQRVSERSGQGFNVLGEIRLTSPMTVLAGLTNIDQNYLIPGYMSPNADRYERGTRVYTQGTYALTPEWSVGWFQGEAFATDYPIPNRHRWEAVVTFNPTTLLRTRRVF